MNTVLDFTKDVQAICPATKHQFGLPVFKEHTEHEVIGYMCAYCGTIAPFIWPEKKEKSA
jgi:hypothetical protein